MKLVAEFTKMKFLLSKEELQTQFNIPDFVLKTQRQIAKDFAIIGFSFDTSFESEEFDYPKIKSEVQSQIEEVMKLGESNLLQLLYQIDIPQSKFLSIITEANFIEQISEMIIRREAYKVFLRSKF